MNKKTTREVAVESYQVYSLDRCIKCLNVLNLGQQSFCAVTLKPVWEPLEARGEEGLETP